ncbi:MAG: YebC/PmpR family DNA-binding transcriptional regulator [Legionellales bacterium]|nr:YebC/PmpR family DNA-binding transcriptional regulator [Legionellales bacterium]HAV94049.1 YebC/PmpR family DNA-binding transcriptional regulator [Pseudomonadota bacterium]
MAGHSKWANIKHRKGRQDALRGKMNTKLIREITVATKESGGDPSSNPRLRLAMDKASRANVTKDSIKKAIDKGMGTMDGADYQEVRYEGYGPQGVAILVFCLTDNKNRTVAEVRHAFSKYGGNLGTDGSVSYLFNRQAKIVVQGSVDDEALMSHALDCGADDFSQGETPDTVVLTLPPAHLATAVDALKSHDYVVEHADNHWVADMIQPLDATGVEKTLVLYEVLLDLDDVQSVFTNADLGQGLMD